MLAPPASMRRVESGAGISAAILAEEAVPSKPLQFAMRGGICVPANSSLVFLASR